MNTLDEYRRNARECQRMADNARNPTDRASWLRLAASWLGMIKDDSKRAFENEAKEAEGAQGAESANAPWPNPSDEDSQASH
jgi:hypothetical protein